MTDIKPFVARLTAPEAGNEWYYGLGNPYVKKGYGLPNCTCYACGRFAELHGAFVSGLAYGNAENWWGGTSKLAKGQEPRLGAIMCWRKGEAYDQSDGAGHVGVVEKISEDGTITMSESNYSGPLFKLRTFAKNDYRLGTNMTFQGFIYPNVTFVAPKLSPVARDTRRKQVKMVKDGVPFRPLPSEKSGEYGVLSQGFYHVLDEREAEQKTWLLLAQTMSGFGFDAWAAYDASKMAMFLPEEDPKDKQIRELTERVRTLEAAVEEIKAIADRAVTED